MCVCVCVCVCTYMHVGGCVDCVHGVCGMCTCVCVCVCVSVHTGFFCLLNSSQVIQVWGVLFNSNHLFVV